VKGWTKGDRVGVGWHGGEDGTCTACKKGDFANCAKVLVCLCGLSYDGGYQEYMIAPVEALARIPESLDPVDAALLICQALRHSTPFGIAGQCRGTLSPFRGSEGSVISGFNSRRKPAIELPRWAGR
jgi:hypothetical protein